MRKDSSAEEGAARPRNVGAGERVVSAVAGSALVALGLARRSAAGLAMAATGGTLVYRGVGGHCPLYRMLGIDRAASSSDGRTGNLGVKVEQQMQFDAAPRQIYAFWHLPSIMPDLDSVEMLSDRRSRWRVKGPAGTALEWDAEIINDKPNELIAWQTEPGARVPHAGSVRFEPRAAGTMVRVALQYDPPGGEFAHVVARMFGTDPGKRIEESLTRLKEALNRAGEDRGRFQGASEALGYRTSP